MSDDRFKALWLGIFLIAGIALTAWLLLFLKPAVGNGEVKLTVRFANIQGIKEGTRVTYAGKPVGYVESIKVIKDPRAAQSDKFGNLYLYEVVLRVDSMVKVFSYDEVLFTSEGLLGEKAVAINPKARPYGAPQPKNITEDLLYARSTDKLEEALDQLTNAVDTFEDTMDGVNQFIQRNSKDFNTAIRSLNRASNSLTQFVDRANETDILGKATLAFEKMDVTLKNADIFLGDTDQFVREINRSRLVERMSQSFSNVQSFTDRIMGGEGTLGKLLSSDSFYLQVTSMLCKLETLLNDINHYGLLFQYDKGWKRNRMARMNKMQSLCTPCDFYRYFDQEMQNICVSLGRVSTLVETMDCQEIPIQNACFADSFLELLGKVQSLEATLKLYTEMMMNQYCQECRCN